MRYIHRQRTLHRARPWSQRHADVAACVDTVGTMTPASRRINNTDVRAVAMQRCSRRPCKHPWNVLVSGRACFSCWSFSVMLKDSLGSYDTVTQGDRCRAVCGMQCTFLFIFLGTTAREEYWHSMVKHSRISDTPTPQLVQRNLHTRTKLTSQPHCVPRTLASPASRSRPRAAVALNGPNPDRARYATGDVRPARDGHTARQREASRVAMSRLSAEKQGGTTRKA
ncbi:hypothetical protein BD414DRAFT_491327 [Trametes punicea]|nr:hypothetical protein BD414DRAFT_491327 [Trametes punicea]